MNSFTDDLDYTSPDLVEAEPDLVPDIISTTPAVSGKKAKKTNV